MPTPIEKIETIVLMAMNGAGVEQKEAELQARVVVPMIEELFHSFALELAEKIERKRLENIKEESTSDWFYGYGFNSGIDSAATFIREAVKTDE